MTAQETVRLATHDLALFDTPIFIEAEHINAQYSYELARSLNGDIHSVTVVDRQKLENTEYSSGFRSESDARKYINKMKGK